MNQDKSYTRSMLVGAAGGLVGLVVMGWVMKASQRVLPKPSEEEPEDEGAENGESISVVGKHYRDGEPATAALGRLFYSRVAGHVPAKKTEERLSNAVHWSYGLGVATLYAALKPARLPGWQSGLLFGLGLWAVGDELMVPLLGLSKGPQAHPLSTHASALLGHLAYGAAVGATVDAIEGRL